MGWHIGLVVAQALGCVAPYTGGSIRFSDGYVYHIYDGHVGENSAFTPLPGATLPATVDVFMCGGGASGSGATYFGGGGGGEAFVVLGHTAPAYSVGAFVGAASTDAPGIGTFGYSSTFDGLTARGGNPGGFSSARGGGDSGNLNAGGFGSGTTAGGGGAGTSAIGGNAPNSATGGNGGAGLSNDWRTGTSEVYGSGGAGYSTTPGTPGDGGGVFGTLPEANRGGGGGGGPVTGDGGAAGLIIIRYLDPCAGCFWIGWNFAVGNGPFGNGALGLPYSDDVYTFTDAGAGSAGLFYLYPGGSPYITPNGYRPCGKWRTYMIKFADVESVWDATYQYLADNPIFPGYGSSGIGMQASCVLDSTLLVQMDGFMRHGIVSTFPGIATQVTENFNMYMFARGESGDNPKIEFISHDVYLQGAYSGISELGNARALAASLSNTTWWVTRYSGDSLDSDPAFTGSDPSWTGPANNTDIYAAAITTPGDFYLPPPQEIFAGMAIFEGEYGPSDWPALEALWAAG